MKLSTARKQYPMREAASVIATVPEECSEMLTDPHSETTSILTVMRGVVMDVLSATGARGV